MTFGEESIQYGALGARTPACGAASLSTVDEISDAPVGLERALGACGGVEVPQGWDAEDDETDLYDEEDVDLEDDEDFDDDLLEDEDEDEDEEYEDELLVEEESKEELDGL